MLLYFTGTRHVTPRPFPFPWGFEVDLWSSLYWFSPGGRRCPYRATSRRAILHSDSTYTLSRFSPGRWQRRWRRRATGRRLLLAQCFTRLVAGRRVPTVDSIAMPRKSRVILYDRDANLSVLIRNSSEQEMNPSSPVLPLTPLVVPSLVPSLSLASSVRIRSNYVRCMPDLMYARKSISFYRVAIYRDADDCNIFPRISYGGRDCRRRTQAKYV